MSTFKNKNSLEQLRLKLCKNLRNMRLSQNLLVLIKKEKRVLSVLYADYSDSRLLHVEGGTTINTGHISMYLSDNLLNLKLCHEI